MNNINNILEKVIDKIDNRIDIIRIDGNNIHVNTVRWLSKDFYFGNMLVKEVDYDYNIINVDTVKCKEGDIVEISKPKFFYGMTREVGAEMNEYTFYYDKLPCIWLMEEYRYTEYFGDTSKNADYFIRLYFLSQSDYTSWKRKDYNGVLRAMDNLKRDFLIASEKIKEIKAIDSITNTIKTRLGVYINYKGVETSLFADNLSGIEADFTITEYLKHECF